MVSLISYHLKTHACLDLSLFFSTIFELQLNYAVYVLKYIYRRKSMWQAYITGCSRCGSSFRTGKIIQQIKGLCITEQTSYPARKTLTANSDRAHLWQSDSENTVLRDEVMIKHNIYHFKNTCNLWRHLTYTNRHVGWSLFLWYGGMLFFSVDLEEKSW